MAFLWRSCKTKRQRTPFNLTMVHYYSLTALHAGYSVANDLYVTEIPYNARTIESIIHVLLTESTAHVLTNLICVVSVQRYIAVCRPLKAKSLVTTRRTKIQIAVSYSVTLIYCAMGVARFLDDDNATTSGGVVTDDGQSEGYCCWWTWTSIGLMVVIQVQIVMSNVVYLVIFYKNRSGFFGGADGSARVGGERSRKLILRTSIFCFLLAVTSLVVSFPVTLSLLCFPGIIHYTNTFYWLDLILAAIYYILLMRGGDNNNAFCCCCCCCIPSSSLSSAESNLPRSLSSEAGQSRGRVSEVAV